jgi:mannose-6-phosphate isomerase-like protein (cupin superfamily)
MSDPTVSEPDAKQFYLDRDGFSDPVRLFTKEQCSLIVRHWLSVRNRSGEWIKGRGASDRFFFDLAKRPSLIVPLKAHLGEDIILWGASIIERPPGEIHPWHTDIESSGSEGFVSVWIGLQNTSQDSALKLLSGSHRFGQPLQKVRHERGVLRGLASDDEVLQWAHEYCADARLIELSMSDGEALFFDGRLWHSSKNIGKGTRIALLLQFAAANRRVLKADFSQLEWPFRLEPEPPPVVVVSGTAPRDHNRVVPPPALPSRNRVSTVCYPFERRSVEETTKAWRSYPILCGSTPNAPFMDVHISVLAPGHSPHPPHVHVEEEILVVLDGEADILIGNSPDPAKACVEHVCAGTFSYYPAYQHHTIRNSSSIPITYLMFKWRGPAAETTGQMKTGIFRLGELLTPSPRKLETRLVCGQSTGYLRKLQSHITLIQPGVGYAPHADKHDVAIVVLSGRVRSTDVIIGANGVMYFPGGEMHGMENVGTETARYLVFEFHSPQPNFHVAEDSSDRQNEPQFEAFDDDLWSARVQQALEEIETLLPKGNAVIIVDQDEWDISARSHARSYHPFLEKQGQYWGPPANGEVAIRELERMRRAGATFIAIGWPAFWWLDHYRDFADYIRRRYACLLENDRVTIFDLRSRSESGSP